MRALDDGAFLLFRQAGKFAHVAHVLRQRHAQAHGHFRAICQVRQNNNTPLVSNDDALLLAKGVFLCVVACRGGCADF